MSGTKEAVHVLTSDTAAWQAAARQKAAPLPAAACAAHRGEALVGFVAHLQAGVGSAVWWRNGKGSHAGHAARGPLYIYTCQRQQRRRRRRQQQQQHVSSAIRKPAPSDSFNPSPACRSRASPCRAWTSARPAGAAAPTSRCWPTHLQRGRWARWRSACSKSVHARTQRLAAYGTSFRGQRRPAVLTAC